MSCDNVPHNGKVCRDAVAGLAAAQDAGFASWVRDTVAFPNAMVDRIAPATSDRERKITRDDFGIEDAWPVFCEDFIQWVVEDSFTAGRPAFEEAGAEFVADVTPYEMMKIRILNGGHAIIAYPAGLMDIHFVHEGMENPLVRAFLQKVERDEIIPIVPPVPNTDLDGYFRKVEERCLNPKIGDTIRRLCLDGSNRQPKFIIPSIADRLARGLPVEGLALASALWARYCAGRTDSGATIEPNDPNWDRLAAQAEAARLDPPAWLAMRDIYGATADAPAFRDAFARWLGALWSDGTEATLAPLPRVTGRPQPASSSSTATACSSTASRSRCACSSTPSPPAGSSSRPPRRTRSSSAARSPPPARSSPATTASPSATPPSTTCAARSTPPSAPSSQPIPGIAETLDALPCPTASPPPRSPSGCSSPSR